MFSKACEYGIKACVYIALQSLQERRVSLREIAKKIDSPEAFTAKILYQLAKNGTLSSVKGPHGGFEIKKTRLDQIMMSEIVSTIDGNSIYEGCALGFKECDGDRPCPLHNKFMGIRSDLKKMLENTSLYELAMGLEMNLTFMSG